MKHIEDRNEIKISFDEPKYHIDLVNKVVVCILKGVPKLPNAIDWTSCSFTDSYFPDKYIAKGVARLNPGDIFDEEKGMKVALAKAENKIYSMLGDDLKDYMTGVKRIEKQCKDFLYKATKVISHNDLYLAKF